MIKPNVHREQSMPKQFSAFILCTVITISCSRTSAPGRGMTTEFTVRNEAELRDGAARVEQLKQELLGRGFRETAVSTSNYWDEVTQRRLRRARGCGSHATRR
jgi:hypothetical protein